MCGIVAYIGNKEACPILIKGLQRLEYRGYDSAGIALMNQDKINLYKVAGKVSDLQNRIAGQDTAGNVGIGHTRWATHGEPNEVNAHPHTGESEDLVIIHNGIIENYEPLKKELIKRGHHFKSETDTEVLIHLIEDIQNSENNSLEEAVRTALSKVVGAYAIVVMSKAEPNTLVAARKGSPLVVGIGNQEYFLASDATPIVEFTKNVIYLKDQDVAVIKSGSIVIKTIYNELKTPYVQELDINLDALEKQGYEYFMLKEIWEQPQAVRDCLRGRLLPKEGILKLGGVEEYDATFQNLDRILMIACGTSWHAALIGEYMIEQLARIPVEVEYASEFRYRDPIINDNDMLIAISQSGETADSLAAIELAKQKGATVFGICNVVGSSIPRVTDAGIYTHAGPEIGVASTKAFTNQLVALGMIAITVAYKKGKISASRYRSLLYAFDELPGKIQETLEKVDTQIQHIAGIYQDAPNALYLGRGANFPIALEGALKLKEISYIHAEGYPAAEMKHGPIALIDDSMPVVVIATNKTHYEKVVSNIQEVKSRKGQIISVVTTGDTTINEISNHVIKVPETDEFFMPILANIPLQLLAYHIAVLRGCNVDQPRNLAKSVTVE